MLAFLLTLVFINDLFFIVLRRLQEPRQVGGRGKRLANQKAVRTMAMPSLSQLTDDLSVFISR